MASYFIKYKISSYSARDVYRNGDMIIDFDKFEKVDSASIYKKIREKLSDNSRDWSIESITKL